LHSFGILQVVGLVRTSCGCAHSAHSCRTGLNSSEVMASCPVAGLGCAW
jgi:hypothetical protein